MSSLIDRHEVGGQVSPSTSISSPPSVLISPSEDLSDSSEPALEKPTRSSRDTNDLIDDAHQSSSRRGAAYVPRVEKLEQVVNVLWRTNMSFEEMIETWVGSHPGSEGNIVSHRQYRTVRQRRQAMSKALQSLVERDICQEQTFDYCCASELDVLITQSLFSKFTVDFTLESLDYRHSADRIQVIAPTWYYLLRRLLSNRRSHRPSYTARISTRMWLNVSLQSRV